MDRLTEAGELPAAARQPARSPGADLASGAMLAALAAAYAAGALTIPGGTESEPGPRLFPLVLGALLGAIGVWIAGSAWREVRGASAGAQAPPEGSPSARAGPWLAAVATLAYAALFQPVGFTASTLAYTAAVTALFTRDRRYLVAVPVGVTLALFAFFRLALGVRLPPGVFG